MATRNDKADTLLKILERLDGVRNDRGNPAQSFYQSIAEDCAALVRALGFEFTSAETMLQYLQKVC